MAAVLSFNRAQAQTLGVNVSGVIPFDGPTGAAAPVNFVFSSVSEPYTFSTTGTRNADGTFAIDTIPNGKFLVAVSARGQLQKVVPVDTTAGDVSNLSIALLAGDANGDNSCDSTDFGLLIGAYNTSASIPGSGYDPNVDFNYDGSVDSTDFGLLIGNFNNQGDIYAWNLTVTPAASGLTLDWTTNSVGASYNVYRSTTPGGTGTLYASKITQTTYTDPNASSGAAYYYQVSAVSQNGETQKSNEATGKISATPELQITNIANGATLSGEVQITVAYSGFTPRGMRSVLDGEYISQSSPTQTLSGPGQIYFSLPTDSFSNGQHTFRIVDGSGRSDVRTINFSNAVSNIYYNGTIDTSGTIDPQVLGVCTLSADLNSKQTWTVTIQTIADTPVILRTFSGNSNAINAAWDGKDTTGAEVPDGNYDIVIQATVGPVTGPVQPRTPPIAQHRNINKIRGLHDALVWMDDHNDVLVANPNVPGSPSGIKLFWQYAYFISSKLSRYKGTDFDDVTFLGTDSDHITYKDKQTGKRMFYSDVICAFKHLSHPLKFLYIDTHGENAPRPFFGFGALTFYTSIIPGEGLQGKYAVDMQKICQNVGYGNNVDPPLLVWLDACCSAGGHDERPDTFPDYGFANDFGYGLDSPGVFMGWNAYATCFGFGTCWDYWRNQFWQEIGFGHNFGTAFDHTNTYTTYRGLGTYTGTASPTYRAVITGNLNGSL